MEKLVTVTTAEIISSLNKEDIILLYPLKDFCVGYEIEFNIEKIDGYILINRLLEDSDLDKLSFILKESKAKGIVFDDLGVLEITKELDLKKILILDHLATNTRSINYYLEYVDSVIISNDLTEKEIRDILKNASKPLVVNVFGLKTLMYSRRHLLKNYHDYYGLSSKKVMDTSIDNKYFKIIENEWGTKFYAYPYYDARCLEDAHNVLYFWYDPIFLTKNEIEDLILNNNLNNIKTTSLFLDKETIYKVGDKND